MTVLVHNIQNTERSEELRLPPIITNTKALASGTTDDKGQVRLDLSSGRPFYLIASQGTQRSYLRVDNGSALSLSSFDVSGEVVQKGIKGFTAYGERAYASG